MQNCRLVKTLVKQQFNEDFDKLFRHLVSNETNENNEVEVGEEQPVSLFLL
jgi:hypothetical protein